MSAGALSRRMAMEIYQHDRPALFEFVLRGDLMGDRVLNLEHAWDTARSILGGKELVVDIAGVTHADAPGMALLTRMRAAGARLTAGDAPESAEFARSLGISAPAGRERRSGGWALRLLRLGGSCG